MKVQNKKIALLLSYFYIALNTVCGLFTSSVIVKTLGATDYGIYQIATSFSSILALLNFGTGTVMLRNLVAAKTNKKYSEEEIISTITWMTAFVCVIMLVCIFIFYSLFDTIYANSLTKEQILQAKPLFVIASLNMVMTLLFQTFEGIVHGNDDFVSPKLFSICYTIVYLVIVVTVFPLFKDAMVLVASNFAIQIAGIIFMLLLSRRWYKISRMFSIKKFKKTIFLSSLSFAVAMLLQVFVNQAITQIPKTLIGIFLTPEAVTLFSIALYVYNMFSSVLSVPINIFLPKTVRQVEKNELKNINWDFLITPCRLNSLLGGMLLFGFFAIGERFVVLMYGYDQKQAWLLALILLIPMYFNMLFAPCINVLDALNKRLIRSLIVAASAILSIISTLLLLKKYGIIVSVISIGVALILGNTVAMAIYYKKALGIPVRKIFFSSLKGILPSLIMPTVIVYLLSGYLNKSFFSFILLGFLFVLILFISLLLFGFSNEERNYIIQLIKKIKSR